MNNFPPDPQAPAPEQTTCERTRPSQPRKLSRLCAGVGLDSFLEALGKENSFLQGWSAATAALTNSSGVRGIPQAASTVEAETSELVLEAEAPRTLVPFLADALAVTRRSWEPSDRARNVHCTWGGKDMGALSGCTDRPVALAGCEHDLLMLRHK